MNAFLVQQPQYNKENIENISKKIENYCKNIAKEKPEVTLFVKRFILYVCPYLAWPWSFLTTVCITSGPQLATQSPKQNVSAIVN